MESHLQHLIGRLVVGSDDKPVGRVDEIAAEVRDGALFVTEYHVESFALLERVASASISRPILKSLGMRKGNGMAVPLDKLDLCDPARPKVLFAVSGLSPPREVQG